MSENEPEKTLEEADNDERAAVADVEEVVFQVYEESQPDSLPALITALREKGVLAERDRSLVRLAVLGLLNSGRVRFGDGHRVAAAS